MRNLDRNAGRFSPISTIVRRALRAETIAPQRGDVVDVNFPSAGSRRRLAALLAVTTLFAGDLCYHFASLEWRRAPYEQRINNGTQPTFFAFHISPYYNFSEDFHLYYVRAKRIAQRGWTDDLLFHRSDAKSNYSAPLQVALGQLAAMTDGKPIPYAVFMFATLAAGWGLLLIAARHWLPAQVNDLSLLAAVLLTVLIEAVQHIYASPQFPNHDTWPFFRGLRMSTMAWTTPMLLAVFMGLVSIAVHPERRRKSLVAVALMLATLLATDNWAFAMAWAATGFVGALLATRVIWVFWRRRERISGMSRTVAALAVVVVASFAMHAKLSGSMQGDALLRGGFGAEWIGVDQRRDLVPFMEKWFLRSAGPLAAVGLAAFALLRPVTRREEEAVATTPATAPPRETMFWSLWALALLTPIVTALLYTALKRGGAEPYLRNQLYWRAEYCLAFPVFLSAIELLRVSLAPWQGAAAARRWTMGMVCALVAFFFVHDARGHRFVKHVASREFYVPGCAERLVEWLKDFETRTGRFELATMSPELNYLAAYWTNADLWLASGFPYHDGSSNRQIEDRTLSLLRLYNSSPQTWLAFTKPEAVSFCDNWVESRVKSAGQGMIYHLFHRLLTHTNARYVLGDWRLNPRFYDLERERIAELIVERQDETPPQPTVIVVDPVSRALGTPTLAGYSRAFKVGDIEAWVRDEATAQVALTSRLRKASTPLRQSEASSPNDLLRR